MLVERGQAAILVILYLLTTFSTAQEDEMIKPSKKTMRKLCEMPEFQQAMAADEGTLYFSIDNRHLAISKYIKKISLPQSHVNGLVLTI